MIVNGKYRKRKIIQLEQDEGTIVGHENVKLYISNFYKKLFGAPVVNFVSRNEDMVEDVPQLGEDENELLTTPFTEKEVFEAISQMNNNKPPGPDDFLVEFYKRCWDIIKLV